MTNAHEYQRKYREANREKAREYQRQRRANETPEQRENRLRQIREANARRKAEDPESVLAAARVRKKRYRSKPEVRKAERKKAREYAALRKLDEQAAAMDRNTKFKRHHGVSIDEADAMIETQNGLCAICNQLPTGKGHCARLHVDHCHETGKIRAMLCSNCNKALGLMQDDPILLEAAAQYLRSHSQS